MITCMASLLHGFLILLGAGRTSCRRPPCPRGLTETRNLFVQDHQILLHCHSCHSVPSYDGQIGLAGKCNKQKECEVCFINQKISRVSMNQFPFLTWRSESPAILKHHSNSVHLQPRGAAYIYGPSSASQTEQTRCGGWLELVSSVQLHHHILERWRLCEAGSLRDRQRWSHRPKTWTCVQYNAACLGCLNGSLEVLCQRHLETSEAAITYFFLQFVILKKISVLVSNFIV